MFVFESHLLTLYCLANACQQAYEDKPAPVMEGGWLFLSKSVLNNYGYSGVAYIHSSEKYVIIAHRGTNPALLSNLLSDASLTLSQLPKAQIPAQEFSKRIRSIAPGYHIIETGHSLGGFHAELNVALLDSGYAITFESPGSEDMLRGLKLLEKVKKSGLINNFIVFFSTPNVINTAKGHIGKMYRILTYHVKEEGYRLDQYDYLKELAHALIQLKTPVDSAITASSVLSKEVMMNVIRHQVYSHELGNILKAIHPQIGFPWLVRRIKKWPSLNDFLVGKMKEWGATLSQTASRLSEASISGSSSLVDLSTTATPLASREISVDSSYSTYAPLSSLDSFSLSESSSSTTREILVDSSYSTYAPSSLDSLSLSESSSSTAKKLAVDSSYSTYAPSSLESLSLSESSSSTNLLDSEYLYASLISQNQEAELQLEKLGYEAGRFVAPIQSVLDNYHAVIVDAYRMEALARFDVFYTDLKLRNDFSLEIKINLNPRSNLPKTTLSSSSHSLFPSSASCAASSSSASKGKEENITEANSFVSDTDIIESDKWLVSLLKSSTSDHAFLLLEGLQNEQPYRLRSDCFLNLNKPLSLPEPAKLIIDKIFSLSKTTLLGHAFIETKEIGEHQYNQHFKDCQQRQSWPITRDQAEKLMNRLVEEAKGTKETIYMAPGYHPSSRASGSEAHNCMTWCIKILDEVLGIQVIDGREWWLPIKRPSKIIKAVNANKGVPLGDSKSSSFSKQS